MCICVTFDCIRLDEFVLCFVDVSVPNAMSEYGKRNGVAADVYTYIHINHTHTHTYIYVSLNLHTHIHTYMHTHTHTYNIGDHRHVYI